MTNFTEDEMRVIRAMYPPFIRMLEEKERRLLDQIVSKYHNGKTDFLPEVAQFTIIREQRRDIETALKREE